jgi:hypothetical protein
MHSTVTDLDGYKIAIKNTMKLEEKDVGAKNYYLMDKMRDMPKYSGQP